MQLQKNGYARTFHSLPLPCPTLLLSPFNSFFSSVSLLFSSSHTLCHLYLSPHNFSDLSSSPSTLLSHVTVFFLFAELPFNFISNLYLFVAIYHFIAIFISLLVPSLMSHPITFFSQCTFLHFFISFFFHC